MKKPARVRPTKQPHHRLRINGGVHGHVSSSGGVAQEGGANTEEGRALFEAALCHMLNFHHEAAIAAFTKAAEVDAGVAPMAKWGIASSLGSHYNFPPGLGASLLLLERSE